MVVGGRTLYIGFEPRRAPKRSRAAAGLRELSDSDDDVRPSPAFPATAATATAAEAANGVNHFARLPDELVLRIFSELEGSEAHETNRLWAVDRRFRRLARGVEWQELQLEPQPCKQPCSSQVNEQERLLEYGERLRQIAACVRSGALVGCRRLFVSPACSYSRLPDTLESVTVNRTVMVALLELLKALATAPLPLEQLCLTGSWEGWPSETVQRRRGITEPFTLEDVARAILAAMNASRLRSLELHDWHGSLQKAFIAAAGPHFFPHLRGLKTRMGSIQGLKAEDTWKLARKWRGLQQLSCRLVDGRALQELSALPLDDLRVRIESNSGLESALGAIRPDCVREIHLASAGGPVAPGILAAISRCRNLESLTAPVDQFSGGTDFFRELGALKKLRRLSLGIFLRSRAPPSFEVVDAPNGGAGLLEAAAACVATAPALRSVSLKIDGGSEDEGEEGGDAAMEPAAVAALLRASAATAGGLEDLEIRGLPASREVLREIARAGPKLRALHLRHSAADGGGLEQLQAFAELRGMALRENSRSIVLPSLKVFVPEELRVPAMQLFRSWFGRDFPISVLVNHYDIYRSSSFAYE
eukprot:tig00021038_g17529.t1